ncbi:hypothetical protein J6590_078777, partial [Homalodisca vitripennis]
ADIVPMLHAAVMITSQDYRYRTVIAYYRLTANTATNYLVGLNLDIYLGSVNLPEELSYNLGVSDVKTMQEVAWDVFVTELLWISPYSRVLQILRIDLYKSHIS